ncbi:MAG TPA: ATP-binding protein [Planctomycetota bacterium]|nr:ATP-binding protein [Planctomycetota bacterium]
MNIILAGQSAMRLKGALAPLGYCVSTLTSTPELFTVLAQQRFDLLVIEEPFLRPWTRQIFSLCQRRHAALLVLGDEPPPECLTDSMGAALDWDVLSNQASEALLRSRVTRLLSLQRVRERLREQGDALRQQEEHLFKITAAARACAAADSLTAVLQVLADYARAISGARTCSARLFPGNTVIRTLEATSPALGDPQFIGPVLAEKGSAERSAEPRVSLPLRSEQGHTLGVLVLSLQPNAPYPGSRLEFFAEVAGALLESAILVDTRRSSHLRDEFLSTLSHELRTPLTSILAWTRLLRTRRLDPTATEHGLEIIERNVRTQAQVVEDLLDVSLMVSGSLQLDFEPLDLSVCVAEAIQLLEPQAQARQIHVSAILDPNARMVGDPGRLRQVAWNLISNAIKFSPPKGNISVRLERDGSVLRLSVSDSGPGIRAEFLPHLFEHFRHLESPTTRATRGLGLGLAIVKNLVERHGGSISVANVPGGGATFRVVFPVSAVAPQDNVPAAAASAAPLRGIRVLLVEDNADASELLVRVLKDFNCEVCAAGSAREALAALDRFLPDVLISDINMPGQDGLQLLHMVRSRKPEDGGSVPAIALTALSGPDERERCLEQGFQLHLAKPVEPATLARAIATLCGRMQDERRAPVATVA